MKKLFLVLFFAIGLVPETFAQSFPERCEGKWEGTMHIWAKGMLVDSVGILFSVQPFAGEAGYWYWKTEYVSEKVPMVKDYTLIQKQDTPNEFLMDEGDGVVLTNYVFGNKMYGLFRVGKVLLTSCYELVGEHLIFEVTSGQKEKTKSKGVTNYSYSFLQRVVLKRIE